MRTLPGVKPRLLFLAYYFPPAREIACARSFEIAKTLARNGWDVTVVTPRADAWRRADGNDEIDRTLTREGIHCVRTQHPWRFLTPDYTVSSFEGAGWLVRRVGERLAAWVRRFARGLRVPREIGWVRELERATAHLAPGGVDLVLATGSPFAAFAAARRLAGRLSCPFVLDYRDSWFGNPYVGDRAQPGTVREEQGLLAECAAAIAVSPGLARALQRRGVVESKIHVVSNGYDAEELADVNPQDFGHFAIVYAGLFYPPRSVVSPVMAAIARLATPGNAVSGVDWRFHYYGRHAEHVRDQARRFGVERRVVIHGEVPRRHALSAVKGAGVAVVITSVSREGSAEERAVVTGKVFDAIGLGTPILAIAPPESDLEAVLHTAGLGRRFSGHEVPEIAAYLAAAMRGRVPPPRDRDAFEWTRLGSRLDGVLRGARLLSSTAPSTPIRAPSLAPREQG
jgi:glycosyltransferase involved in cell wall biosynthesis